MPQCNLFVQNAWKKDLCSNCFKSKEEHTGATDGRSRYLATMIPVPSPSTPATKGILKDGQQPSRRPKGVRVIFPAEESQVIGYGGEECILSEDEDRSEEEVDSIIEDLPGDGELEREIQKLTRSNTDFNTVAANLLGVSNGEPKRSFTQLMLGKPLTDAEGRKKTLLVSVQPFGGPDCGDNRKATPAKANVVKNVEQRDVIKLDVKIGDVKEEKCKVDDKEEEMSMIDVEVNAKKELVFSDNKISEENEDDKSRIPSIKSRLNNEKTKTVIRTSAFNGRADLETKLEDLIPKPAMRKSYELNNKSSEYIIQKEQSNVVLNLIVKDKSNDFDAPLELKNSDFIINNKEDKESIYEKCDENVLKLTNGSKYELDLEPSKVDAVTGDDKDEVIAEVDDKTSPIVESKNSRNSSLPPLKTETEEVKEAKTVDEAKKLPANIYRKLPLFDEPIILKDVAKSLNTPPVRKVTILESPAPVEELRDIVGESAEILPKESAKVEVYKATKVLVEGLPDKVESFRVEESRELAGEPDGRADSDELSEPPALPSSPPPVLDPRPSFLHGLALGMKRPLGDKPKIPIKSSKVFQATRKAFQQLGSEKHSEIPDLPQDSSSDPLRTPQKRRAPKPPPSHVEETNTSIFARNPSASSKSYSPISREKEKRERASSCSPKSRTTSEGVDKTDVVSTVPCPEPAPRRSLSLSVESLPMECTPQEESKKKGHSRGKFSIRKFLRLGGGKEQEERNGVSSAKSEEAVPLAPSPKPRPEIIHPLELNGTEVEVVRGDGSNVRRSLEDSSSTSSFSSAELRDHANEESSDSFGSHSPNSSTGRPNKPPPPPRNQSLDAWGRSADKPARPPLPKSAELLLKQKSSPDSSLTSTTATANSNVYVNLDLVSGEGRSGLTPNKPQRTASIRDQTSEPAKRKFSEQQPDDGTYEVVEIRSQDKKTTTFSPNPSDGVYECVRNGSPESVSKGSRYTTPHRRSEGSMDLTPDYAKFRGQLFPRSASLPYCGSETESEFYSPYSFYGSEEGGEDDCDYASPGHTWKTNRLRLRKGRSVVHKNLEDNYGAVIIANHEALAQVLEQVNQAPTIPSPLRGLKVLTNLRWNDFTVLCSDSPGIQAGRRVFHAAQWSGQNITLSISLDQSRLPQRSNSFCLSPLTEFNDLVPASFLGVTDHSSELVQASVAVLVRLQVDTIKSYGQSDPPRDDKEASFVLLQLINALKNLQAQGIEDSPLDLSSFVLCREERDVHPRLCTLQSLVRGDREARGSLCQCAEVALRDLVPGTTLLAERVGETLKQERAVSLTQVKSLLEFSLWGPGDVALGAPQADREQTLQRWLDLERATVLHGLVRTRVELTAFEECHLLFLVRTSAKAMSDASFLLDPQRSHEAGRV